MKKTTIITIAIVAIILGAAAYYYFGKKTAAPGAAGSPATAPDQTKAAEAKLIISKVDTSGITEAHELNTTIAAALMGQDEFTKFLSFAISALKTKNLDVDGGITKACYMYIESRKNGETHQDSLAKAKGYITNL